MLRLLILVGVMFGRHDTTLHVPERANGQKTLGVLRTSSFLQVYPMFGYRPAAPETFCTDALFFCGCDIKLPPATFLTRSNMSQRAFLWAAEYSMVGPYSCFAERGGCKFAVIVGAIPGSSQKLFAQSLEAKLCECSTVQILGVVKG
ncbi:hypothetical protein BDW02DRAFT_571153 [Decorospora gaudefroyi]|uniref:Secreted protein n=1 Tax=Decorospora gaudefroyi TaxID=184978 RepID=A0A6A5KG53_9PLEO|nr:hypothetical protein BDW02DRAFT_571153 [Decorospora gaudefroyi]